ncbi:MAG: bifunctional folylpolyglutamate synthase/dihydrofolate synthase [Lachnospiraceae bacterium]|nr:bifunctional folylpolyglutamate synthase/dihydrofolate synthase [Lachnospiraceae bacterium]
MYEQAKDYILKIPFWARRKNTLEQVKDFLRELENPEESLSVIHVAGTNGKGSVCADLTSILREAGYQVGTFVSPHLIDIRERFLINGELAAEADFEDCFRQVLSVTKKMIKQGYCHPTFFEFVFLMAMVLFTRKKTEYVILETGLGGRLDTTNVIARPIGCIITSVSLDHTKYLGDTIPEIAAEKAGIIKAGVPVIYDNHDPSASKVIGMQAEKMGSPAFPVGEMDVTEEDKAFFAAPYQAMNATLAKKALQVLNIPKADKAVCQRGLKKVYWPGRMEEVAPDIWLDGAHNPGGIEAFIQAVHGQLSGKKKNIQLLFAAVEDKDYREMIHLLCKALPLERVTVVHLRSDRGLKEQILAEQFEREGCEVVESCETVSQALEVALSHKTKEDRLYVVGSLYLIGEIKELLRGSPLGDGIRMRG